MTSRWRTRLDSPGSTFATKSTRSARQRLLGTTDPGSGSWDDVKPVAQYFGVEGFPTIKYFNPPDEEGEDYSGGRDLDALKAFAATLGPGCSAAMLDKCTDEEKVEHVRQTFSALQSQAPSISFAPQKPSSLSALQAM